MGKAGLGTNYSKLIQTGNDKKKKTQKTNKQKNSNQGVSVVAQQVMNLTSTYEDMGLIPSLTQWVKDLVLLRAVV